MFLMKHDFFLCRRSTFADDTMIKSSLKSDFVDQRFSVVCTQHFQETVRARD